MTLRTHNLSFGYRTGQPVVDAVNCKAPIGAVTAIIGPNGAGKSTLLRLLAGVRTPWAGHVSLDGDDIKSITPRRRASRIALVAQRPTIAGPFSVEQVIAFGRYARSASPEAITAAIEEFELADSRSRIVHELSVGQQQRVAMARAFAQLQMAPNDAAPSRALLADEPIAAMDPRHAALTMRRLRAISRAGVAVVVILHDLTMALNWSDRAIVMDQGGVCAEGPTPETLTPQRLETVFGAPFLRLESGATRALAIAEAPSPENG